MHSKIVLAAVLLSFFLPAMMGAQLIVSAAGTLGTINVDPSGKIQDAIDLASPGDTIVVASGTYHEHLRVYKSLTLRGAGSDNTFINGDGINKTIVLINASDVVVTGFTIENGNETQECAGIGIYFCENVTIRNNVIRENYFGVSLRRSNNCRIINNTTTDNYHGIQLSESDSNRLTGNTIAKNEIGVRLTNVASEHNILYHNNFINNTQRVPFPPGENTTWHDGYPSGGNYWSDYMGVDEKSGPNQDETGSDGIGDRAYPYLGDRYPLMGPICIFNACTWAEKTYYVDVISNSSISNFYFGRDQELIKFNVTGPIGTDGFCRVTIPRQLLWVESEPWTILVDNTSVDYAVKEDDNHTYLYFTYSHSVRTVVIKGTHVVPEFPMALLLPMFMIATLIAIVFIKKRYFLV